MRNKGELRIDDIVILDVNTSETQTHEYKCEILQIYLDDKNLTWYKLRPYGMPERSDMVIHENQLRENMKNHLIPKEDA